MEEKKLEILHKYILRAIADKNLIFSGISYKYHEESKRMREEIYRNFAMGDTNRFSTTRGNINLDCIKEDIEKNKKSISPYNYFDLDTLIAYNKYLEFILNELYNCRKNECRNYSMIEDFSYVIDSKTTKYFINNAGTKQTGYYNLSRTIVPLKDKDNNITYKRTPEKKSFEKKYSKVDCEKLLKAYIKEKHPEKSALDFDMDDLYDSISLRGVKFYIINQKIYLNSDCSPIKYIVGVTEDRKTEIRGFLDMSGQVYYGDIYDTNGNFVCNREQSGLDVYGNDVKNKFDGMGR